MAELSSAKKADIEALKHFISKQEDIFREAYGRRTVAFRNPAAQELGVLRLRNRFYHKVNIVKRKYAREHIGIYMLGI